MNAVSSRSMPRNWPFGASTPTTRNCSPPVRMRSPRAVAGPKSSFFSVLPSTTKARALSLPLGRRQELPRGHAHVEDLQRVLVDAVDGRAARAAVALDLGVAEHD